MCVEERKDMKRIKVLSLIICAAVLLGMCACSGGKNKDNKNTSDEAGSAADDSGDGDSSKGKKEYEVVTFGHYGNEDIEWIVLGEKDGKTFLLSKYVIEAVPYHTEYVDITWEDCSLRTWLNGEFLETAFTPEEQAKIQITQVENSTGNNTEDKVFILSLDEFNNFLKTDAVRRGKATQYLLDKGIYQLQGCVWWWLRTQGRDPSDAVYVGLVGDIVDQGVGVYHDSYGVRPAMWVELG